MMIITISPYYYKVVWIYFIQIKDTPQHKSCLLPHHAIQFFGQELSQFITLNDSHIHLKHAFIIEISDRIKYSKQSIMNAIFISWIYQIHLEFPHCYAIWFDEGQ